MSGMNGLKPVPLRKLVFGKYPGSRRTLLAIPSDGMAVFARLFGGNREPHGLHYHFRRKNERIVLAWRSDFNIVHAETHKPVVFNGRRAIQVQFVAFSGPDQVRLFNEHFAKLLDGFGKPKPYGQT